MAKKKTIKEFTNLRIYASSMSGSLKDIIKLFTDDLDLAVSQGYKNLEFVYKESEFEYEGDCIELHGQRKETDRELDRRIKRIESSKKSAVTRKKLKEKKEQELYKKLKKKYEGE